MVYCVIFFAEDSSLLECNTVMLGKPFPTFRRTASPSSSRIRQSENAWLLKMKALCPFECWDRDLPSDILETKNPQWHHFEKLKICTFAFSLAGSSHIDTVRVIRRKFFKWREDDDHNTDWWRSARSSNQWYSGDVGFELESHRNGVFISLPFLLTQYSFNYMSVPRHAPRKFIHCIRSEKCKFQLSFLYEGTW